MSKHTPGPWNHYEGEDIYGVFDSAGKKVCTIEPVDIVGWNAVFREEADANQLLIAAAPELLEALERLKIEVVLSDVDPEYIESHFRPWLDKAEAAITKARGL